MRALAPGSSPSNNTICQGFRFLSCDPFLKHSVKPPSGESFAHCRSWIYLLLHCSHICSHFQYEMVFLFQSSQQLHPRLGLLLGITAWEVSPY